MQLKVDERFSVTFRREYQKIQKNTIYPVDRMILLSYNPVSYTHLRAHETGRNLVCRLLLEKKKKKEIKNKKKKKTNRKKKQKQQCN